MINVFNLIWIIPVSIAIGAIGTGLSVLLTLFIIECKNNKK